MDIQKIQINTDPHYAWLDYDRLSFPLTIRAYQSGDTIRPLGTHYTKPLNRYFSDTNIPYHRRHHIPLLLHNTTCLWVTGHHISDHVKVRQTSQKILTASLTELS